MLRWLLTAAALLLSAAPTRAADRYADELVEAINAARAEEGLPAVAPSGTLAASAAIIADWLGYANRRNRDFQYHAVNTAWLRKNYPKLLWAHLDATFPDGLPESLSAHDVARLCGWTGGVVYDIEAEAGRSFATADIVDGWARSPFGHWMVLFDVIGQFTDCGTGSAPRGGGRQIIVACFGATSL